MFSTVEASFRTAEALPSGNSVFGSGAGFPPMLLTRAVSAATCSLSVLPNFSIVACSEPLNRPLLMTSA